MQELMRPFIQFLDQVEVSKGILSVDALENLGPGPMKMMSRVLREHQTLLQAHGLTQSLGVISRLQIRLEALSKAEIHSALDDLKRAFVADLSSRYVFIMDEDKQLLFGSGFTFKVAKAFPSAAEEIREANSCYSLGRNTATVFHCMRAIEHGMRALLVAVGGPSGAVPLGYLQWNEIIEQVDSKWKSIEPQWKGSPELTNAREFFSRTVGDLKGFKDAARNISMHTRNVYDESGARSELGRTREWFERLASKVHENMSPGELLDKKFFAP